MACFIYLLKPIRFKVWFLMAWFIYLLEPMRLKVLLLMAIMACFIYLIKSIVAHGHQERPRASTGQFIFMALLPPVPIKLNGDLKILSSLV